MITVIDIADRDTWDVRRADTFLDHEEVEAMELFEKWATENLPDGEAYEELWFADGYYGIGDGGIYVIRSCMSPGLKLRNDTFLATLPRTE